MRKVKIDYNGHEYSFFYEILRITDGTTERVEHRLVIGEREIKAETLEKAVAEFKKLVRK